MNKLLKVIIVAVLAIVMSCQYTIISNAADEVSVITLKTSTAKIEPKDEIKVYIYYGEKETYDGGVAYIEGNLEYDKNVLEAIITNGSTYNDWVMDYNETDGKFALTRNDIVSDSQEVAEIVFKVKEDVTTEETAIYLKNIEIANLEDDTIESKDEELKFTISSEKEDDKKNTNTNTNNTNTNTNKNNTNTNTNNTNTNTNKNNTNTNTNNTNTNTNKNNTNTNNNKNENQNTNKNTNGGTTGNSGVQNSGKTNTEASSSDSTQKNASLPYTGVVQWIITAILVIAIIGLVSYKKYQKYKNI